MNSALRLFCAAVTASVAIPALGQCPGHWSPGGGFTNYAQALTTYQGTLFTAGDFGMMDPPSTVAWFDGAAWRPVPGMAWEIFALGTFNGDLIAGGRIHVYNGTGAEAIARWNDAQGWRPLGAGLSGGDVHSLIVYNNALIAGGSFTYSDTSPTRPQLHAIARWDGSQWQPMGRLDGGSGVLAMTTFNGDLIAAGGFTTIDSQPVARIARWNGTSWSPMGSGMNLDVVSLAVYNRELIAAGMFSYAGSTPCPRGIARWDGQAWQPIPGLTEGGGIRALTVYQGRLVVSGELRIGQQYCSLATWDGIAWEPLGSPQPSAGTLALAEHNSALFAVGGFSYAGASFWARWTTPSTDFNHDGSPGTDADIEAFFACLAGTCCRSCDSADFNADGDVATDADIEAFFRVLGGGSC